MICKFTLPDKEKNHYIPRRSRDRSLKALGAKCRTRKPFMHFNSSLLVARLLCNPGLSASFFCDISFLRDLHKCWTWSGSCKVSFRPSPMYDILCVNLPKPSLGMGGWMHSPTNDPFPPIVSSTSAMVGRCIRPIIHAVLRHAIRERFHSHPRRRYCRVWSNNCPAI